jgi:hypothetical protein
VYLGGKEYDNLHCDNASRVHSSYGPKNDICVNYPKMDFIFTIQMKKKKIDFRQNQNDPNFFQMWSLEQCCVVFFFFFKTSNLNFHS